MLRSGTYTVVFTDLRGSTELRVRMGDVAFDELRRRHDTVLAEAVTAHKGELVKSLGDGIFAVFSGAVDALDAAVAMHQGIGALNLGAPTPLDLAIGISAGDVAVEGDDVHGTPVVEASRLCAAGYRGQIVASDVVRVLAGSRGGHRFEPIGDLSLKGLPEPIRASTVLWEPVRAEPAGTQGRFYAPEVAALARAGFVGRAAEHERLVMRYKEVAAGGSACVLLAGEPGIGKTRLSCEVAAMAHADGATVLFGGCDLDAGVAFQPWARAFGAYCSATDPDVLRDQLGVLGGELARIVPAIGARVTDLPAALHSDPEIDRLRLFEAAAELLGAIGREAPVVVLLDDLHWADKPSLLLLRHVLRSGMAGVLVVGTYRDTDLDRSHPLSGVLADLRRADAFERVSLGGLERDDVADFLRFVSGHDLDADGERLARAVFVETDGNPFFLGEMVRHLVSSAAVVHDGTRWVLAESARDLGAVGLPEGIREMVGRRLSSLSPMANDVLAVAAVAGARFEAAIVATAMNAPVDDVLDALDEAVQARIVVELPEPGRYGFAHALVRQTLDAELSVARRTRWHRAIGHALEAALEVAPAGDRRLMGERMGVSASAEGASGDRVVVANMAGDRVAELARHFAACAAVGEGDRALRYLGIAAEQARRELAFEEAAALYARALDVTDLVDADALVRCDLMTARGEALRLAADPSHRRLLLDAIALAGDDGHRLAAIATALNPGDAVGTFHGVDHDVLDLCEQALVALGPGDSTDRARMLALIGVELSTAPDLAGGQRGQAAAREALAMARRLGDDRCLGQVLTGFWNGQHGPDTFDELPLVAAELERLADALGDAQLRLAGTSAGISAALERGEIDRALDICARHAELADRLHSGLEQWRAGFTRVGVAIHRLQLAGSVNAIDAVADAALAAGVSPSLVEGVRSGGRSQLESCTSPASLPALLDAVESVARAMPGLRSFWAAAADVALNLGDVDRARHDLLQVTENRFADWPRSFWWTAFVTHTTMVAARLGDVEVCDAAWVLLRPCSGQYTLAAAPGFPVDSALAAAASVTGRHDEARWYFERALTQCATAGLACELVVTRIAYAEALLRLPAPTPADRTKAHELLAAAHERATTAGALVLAQRAERVMARL